MKTLNLTKGMVAMVDDKDFSKLNQWKWSALKSKYTHYAVRGKGKIYMHREVLGAPKGKVVDHLNGNGLDNTRKNIRVVTQSDNLLNRPLCK